jgi:hypothetical protein
MWVPDKRVVSLKETVGRRVFHASPYKQRGTARIVRIDIFLEEREGEDGLSFDRLGLKPNHQEFVVQSLSHAAQEEAEKRKPPRPFSGWLPIKVQDLQNVATFKPDPIDGNAFHSLLPLDNFREATHANNLAFRLATLANEGALIPPAQLGAAPTPAASNKAHRFLLLCASWAHQLLKRIFFRQ